MSNIKFGSPVSWEELKTFDLPEREHILSPWMHDKSLSMLFASPGVGKSWLALSIAYAVSAPGKLFSWQGTSQRDVVYVDGEMAASEIKNRCSQLFGNDRVDIRFLAADLHEYGLPDLAYKEAQLDLEHSMSEGGMPHLLVLDNLSSLIHSGNENEAESWHLIQQWMLRLKRRGTSVLLVHHANKSGGARGTSKREDILDAIVGLKPPRKSMEGCAFELWFKKCRPMVQEKDKSLSVILQPDKNGKLGWSYQTSGVARNQQVLELHKEDFSIRDIGAEVGLSKSQVLNILRKAGVDTSKKAKCPPSKSAPKKSGHQNDREK